MEFVARVREQLADSRLSANLIAFYGVIVVTLISYLMLRRFLRGGGSRLVRWTGLHWLHAVGEEATRHARALLFWLTVTTALVTAAGGVAYHLTGGDVRQQLAEWAGQLKAEHLFRISVDAVAFVALTLGAWVAVRLVCRLLQFLETHVTHLLARPGHEVTFRRWFLLLERYLVTAIRLVALGAAVHIVGLGHVAGPPIGFVLRILTILAVGRLLTLASRGLAQPLTDLGDRHLQKGHFLHYWERIKRLIPFSQRCFEAAVYISVASLCVRDPSIIGVVADYGPRIVKCIAILFSTRVLIELLQVLLHEAFGLYDEDREVDQKGRTLVPLLYSVCQYVLYFGSGVVMLSVLGLNTAPVLAGAGILGLGVGLGAQSLVTDVVSGFFILFEGQYLVGDYVQIGDASGVVEAVGIRLTQVRDDSGKLFIIPNGQIKEVISYSKGYVNAVVDVKAPSGNDLESVFRAMAEAGRRLRQSRKEVLADTQIQGVVELGTSEMTVRAVTRVKPGVHLAMQNEYRRLLKQVFDEHRDKRPAGVAA